MKRLIAVFVLVAVAVGACDGGDSGDAQADLTTTDASTSSSTVRSTLTTLTATTSTTTTPVVPTDASGTTTMPTLGPGGSGVIAYNHQGELWLMNSDGTNPHALVTSVVVEGGPSWSPDGTRLAFSGFEPGPTVVTPDIWVVTVDGSSLINLTHSPGPSMLSPSWSPDGSQIVFASTDRDLWIIDVDSGGRNRITSDAAHQSSPAWSPDGSLIAYCLLPVTDGQLGSNDIWVMAPDGNDPERLTDMGDMCLPAWSPDSSQLAFTAWVFPRDAPGDYSDVWVMRRDGTSQRNLTDDPARFDRAPDWSPDGTTIAFDSAGPLQGRQDPIRGIVIEHEPPADVYLIAAGGGPKTQLTTGDKEDGAPAWRPSP